MNNAKLPVPLEKYYLLIAWQLLLFVEGCRRCIALEKKTVGRCRRLMKGCQAGAWRHREKTQRRGGTQMHFEIG